MKDVLKRLADASHRLDSAMREASALHRRRRARHRPRVVKKHRIDVTRAEFERVLRRLADHADTLAVLRNELEIQFRRTAEMQASLDRLTAELGTRTALPHHSRRA